MANDLGRVLIDLLRAGVRARAAQQRGRTPVRRSGPTPHPAPHPTARPSDPVAAAPATYAPRADGRADPGEVVWGWVPFEEDARRGKDRPVLVLARDGSRLLTLMLTSKDHDGGRDEADEARHGRSWMDVGTGGWDRERRPSEVRLDRLITLDEAAVRREGAALPRDRFDAVLAAAARFHPALRGRADGAPGPRR